jgi:hypothetical protein
MTYSYLDPLDNVGIPERVPYAGLYAVFDPKKHVFSQEPKRIEPDAVAYSAEFYAKNHIPTSIRQGNNTIKNNPYKFVNTQYNMMCYSS